MENMRSRSEKYREVPVRKTLVYPGPSGWSRQDAVIASGFFGVAEVERASPMRKRV